MSPGATYLGGRLRIDLDRSEMRMSHWIDCPRVIDTQTGRVLLDLHGSLWDLAEVKEEARSIRLVMRKYPGGSPPVALTLSPDMPGGVLDGRQVDENGLLAALESHG
ncbi:MAG: hypothetical protein U0359_29245 [Byssovorax sp.]